jgi:hypothetical protein
MLTVDNNVPERQVSDQHSNEQRPIFFYSTRGARAAYEEYQNFSDIAAGLHPLILQSRPTPRKRAAILLAHQFADDVQTRWLLVLLCSAVV